MNIKYLDDVKYKIHKINVLNENDKKAKAILKKASEQVLPIMRKRCLSVELLSEFLPKNSNLLGLYVPKNSEIKIRLRNKKGSEIFHFNHIMGTLLHELAHILHARHDKLFYKLLDKLILEYNELYIYKTLECEGKKTADNKKKNVFFNSNPKFMASQAAEIRLINNFINDYGEIRNLNLESCLTEKQRENLFKNRKKHDDIICSLNNDVFIIDSLNNVYKNKENENFTNSVNIEKGNKIFANSESKNKNYSNSKNNKNTINAENNEENLVNIPKKSCVPNNHRNDSVYILKVKKSDTHLKEVNRINSKFCDNLYSNKNKKRKIIILD